jgi:hypothetical protein
MNLLDDVQKIDSIEDNPSYRYRLPAAIVTFKQILKEKYNNEKWEVRFL